MTPSPEFWLRQSVRQLYGDVDFTFLNGYLRVYTKIRIDADVMMASSACKDAFIML